MLTPVAGENRRIGKAIFPVRKASGYRIQSLRHDGETEPARNPQRKADKENTTGERCLIDFPGRHLFFDESIQRRRAFQLQAFAQDAELRRADHDVKPLRNPAEDLLPFFRYP